MGRLGYARYGAQGGDWGAQVTTRIGALDPEHCAAIHLNMAIADAARRRGCRSPTQDKADLAAMQRFQREESGYANEQSTKPQTLGVALNDSPAGLLAWIVEKFRTWSDCDGHPENVFTRDQLLTNVMMYWVTQTSASSARLYWEHQHRGSGRGRAGVRRGPHRHRALPQRGGALPALVGRAALQRHALGRHAARRPLRRDGAARAVRRRPPHLLPRPVMSRSAAACPVLDIRAIVGGANLSAHIEPTRGSPHGAVGRQSRGHHRRRVGHGAGVGGGLRARRRQGRRGRHQRRREGHRRRGRRGRGARPLRRHERSRRRGADARRGRRVRSRRRRVQRRRHRRRHDARRRDDGALRQADGRRPARRALRHEARDPHDARVGQRRRDRQLVVARRAERLALHERVLGREGRRDRAHQGRRDRVRRARASAPTASARASSTPR